MRPYDQGVSPVTITAFVRTCILVRAFFAQSLDTHANRVHNGPMTYSESAKGVTITQVRAIHELQQHGCDNADLQELADHIDPSDTTLLEWAGVPENG